MPDVFGLDRSDQDAATTYSGENTCPRRDAYVSRRTTNGAVVALIAGAEDDVRVTRGFENDGERLLRGHAQYGGA